MQAIEPLILGCLISNEDYTRKVIPFLKEEYFDSQEFKKVFTTIDEHIKKYNSVPTKESLHIVVDDLDDMNEDQYRKVKLLIDELSYPPNIDEQWLLDVTEKFCQDKSLYMAVRQSIGIMDNKEKNLDRGSIPQLLQDALSVSFDTNIGHDYLENADERFEYYHRQQNRVPFDIDLLNKITGGGLAWKSLSIILAGVGVGKTAAMCHFAATNFSHGKNVLYITMEMGEEEIGKRIDANLLDVPLDELLLWPKDVYDKRIDRLKSKSPGQLIVKEYPTASAGSANFRYLLNDLRLKKNFVPDILYIDYLNICTSSRLKNAQNVNSYSYVKAIAEELRGLAVEFQIPVMSATQLTRGGYSSSDVGLEDTSESFGLPATADFMFALTSSEELETLNQMMLKQLKNRWGDINKHRRFVVGVDRAKMRLYNVEESAQDDIMDDTPVMNNSDFGQRWEEADKDAKLPKKFNKNNIWAGFK